MHALITRPLEDAKPLAELLAGRGVECTVEPLLEIAPLADAAIDLDGVQALLFTSANGVRAFAAKSSRRDLKVLTVGDGSATTAREVGFSDVTAAGGDVEALAALVIAKLDPKAGPLFHGAASVLAGDLQGKLEAAGFTLRRVVLYEAKTATTLTHETRMNLALGGVDMLLLFSPRTARTFAELWRKADAPSLGKTTALCLSAAVAREIADLGWLRIETAASPDQSAMLALVEAEIERRSPAVEVLPPKAEAAKEAPRVEESMQQNFTPPPLYNPPPPKEKSGGVFAGIVAGLIAGAAAAVAAVYTQPYWHPQEQAAPAPDQSAELAALQSKIDALAQSSAGGGVSAEAVNAAVNDVKAAIALEIAAATDRIGKLEQSVNTLAQAPATAAPTIDLQPLQDRIAQLESKIADAQQAQAAPSAPAGSDLSGDVAALKSANDALTQQLNAARDEIKALQAQQSELSGTLGKIAAQPAGVTPAEQRRTAAVVALSALRGALPLDKPYDVSLKAIDDLAAADADLKGKLAPALDPLRPLAADGAPTLAQLQASLPTKAIADAANAETTADAVGAEPGWSERLINRLSEAVTVRPVGENAEGDGPLAHLARGEAKLKAGDLAAAAAEIGALQGKAADAAAAWLNGAKARLAQDQASNALDQTATALLAPASGPEQ
ncbi:uroporphyrinogen-III synthase [Dongia sp.]|uniref:uroporphyrinogen-III synthase n=1 Tax=Dongia sp. TaxID=1977262 RepID=UPI003750FBD5